MSLDILMPRLSDTMETGIIGRWLRSDGDFVNEGEPIVEIETDKTTTELLADHEGFLCLLAEEGGSIPTGGLLARIVSSPDEDRPQKPGSPPPKAAPPQPTTQRSLPRPDADTQQVSRRGPRATPVARKLARQAGVELSLIASGSGPEGRIHRIDVERQLASRPTTVPPPSSEADRDQVVEPSRVQALIAQRMTQSKQQVPHYYLTTTAEMSEALELKRAATELRSEIRLSVIDIVLFGCARALATHPSVNASWIDNKIVLRAAINIGLAVALDAGELVVPVIRDASNMSLLELASARRDLTERAREGKLHAREIEGATFTISNLGTYGVTEFHAIVNPPESGILAVGRIEDRVVVHAGQALIRPNMTLSLSADHRVYSGATAAEFISSIRSYVEHPALALLSS
jgi:pyruvate dehydrogenase E2 component (dihydrolipoamide acetyltransferase)